MKPDFARRQTDLFQRLARHRFFYGFAWFDEASESRVHPARPSTLPTQQAFVARHRQHDHDWINARKMLRLARRALALPACLHDDARRAAIGAEAMAGMPFEYALRGTEDRQTVSRQNGAERTQIIEAAKTFKPRGILDLYSEVRGALAVQPQKQGQCVIRGDVPTRMRAEPS